MPSSTGVPSYIYEMKEDDSSQHGVACGSPETSTMDGNLSYKLLLEKTSCQDAEVSGAASDCQSTTEPESAVGSSASSCSACVPDRRSVKLLCNIALCGHADERMATLISCARDLSQVVFKEDCLLEVTKKSGWKLSILTTDDFSILCGFIVSKVTNGSLSVAKIAVPASFRGSGFGRLIMDDVMKVAKKRGDVYDVCLSSLPGAVKFYQRLGFKAFRDMKATVQDDMIEGQVYMEKKLRQRPRRR